MTVPVASVTGSSPHAWGPRHGRQTPTFEHGIIPTRVGTTPCPAWSGRTTRDHPHTRGDHPVVIGSGERKAGSSPHAWGPRPQLGGYFRGCGIIPTRVGTTPGRSTSGSATWDHPHTRGDHGYPDTGSVTFEGSSPHAWGPPHAAIHGDFGCGIIPTRVGTTATLCSGRARRWDHPHTRGDHSGGCGASYRRAGSSPHAWGPRRRRKHPRREAGIIPTRVGTTRNVVLDVVGYEDHPHTRGDHWLMPAWPWVSSGSSPHAWGPPGIYLYPHLLDGIIPTRVGTTTRSFAARRFRGDHPHTRGDHSSPPAI